MNCREFVDFLMAYIDGELPEAERSVFDAHMVDCPPCQTYLETYKETVQLGQDLCRDSDGPIPDEVPERRVAAILAARPRKS